MTCEVYVMHQLVAVSIWLCSGATLRCLAEYKQRQYYEVFQFAVQSAKMHEILAVLYQNHVFLGHMKERNPQNLNVENSNCAGALIATL